MVKKHLYLEEETLELIEVFRVENNISTLSKAVNTLVKKYNENYRNNFNFCDITVIFYKSRWFLNCNWKMDRIFYDFDYGYFYSHSFRTNRKIFKKEK